MTPMNTDPLQEQIARLLAYIQPTCCPMDMVYYAGDLSMISSKLESQSVAKTLFLVLWAGKIYAYFYNPNESLTCPFCLLHAIKRNLPPSGPEYSAIVSKKTLRSDTPVIAPDALINLLLASFEHINHHPLFQNGSKALIYTLNNRTISFEVLFNEPGCERCNTALSADYLPLDNASNLNSSSAMRYFSIDHYQPLMEDFCGKSLGLVNHIAYDLQLPVASCTAKLMYHKDKHELTLGRANKFNHGKTIAIIEALERLAGLNHSHDRHIIFKSFEQIEDQALDPRQFCLHAPAQYALTNFPFVPFHPNLQLPWVKGIELIKNKEVLVCASAIFYGSKQSRQYPMLAFESSNGCAVGSTYDEAILSGILEVIERDAFLYSWYKRASLPDITERMLSSADIETIYTKFKLFSDVDVHFYDAASEHGIPSVFVLAVGRRKGKPRFAAAGGAGINYYDAAKSALYELSCHYIRLQYLLSQPGELDRALLMLHDSSRVLKMEDHGLVNALSDAAPRFEFLLEQKLTLPFRGLEISATCNPKQTLEHILGRLAHIGLTVVAVDQTPLLMRKKQLVCVKVLISDMLPITFGHSYSRLDSKRLATIESFSSVYPHPFP